MALVATLTEAKNWVRYGAGTADDAKMTDILASASQWVEWKLGGPLAVTEFTERRKTNGWSLVPYKRPLVEVESITPDLGTALDPAAYVADTDINVIRFRHGIRPCWVALVYSAGLATVPSKAKTAGLDLFRHLWLPHNGSSGRGHPMEDTVPTPFGFAVPRRVDEMLNPDHVPGFA